MALLPNQQDSQSLKTNLYKESHVNHQCCNYTNDKSQYSISNRRRANINIDLHEQRSITHKYHETAVLFLFFLAKRKRESLRVMEFVLLNTWGLEYSCNQLLFPISMECFLHFGEQSMNPASFHIFNKQ